MQQAFSLAARIPARQLQLASYAALVCLAAILGLGIYKAISGLQAAKGERIQHEQTLSVSSSLRQVYGELAAHLGKLSEKKAKSLPADQTNQAIVEALTGFNQLSGKHGVTLNTVSPLTPGKRMRYQEIPFDLEVMGNYRDVMAWLIDAEQSIPILSVNEFEVTPNGKPGTVLMKARLSMYVDLKEN